MDRTRVKQKDDPHESATRRPRGAGQRVAEKSGLSPGLGRDEFALFLGGRGGLLEGVRPVGVADSDHRGGEGDAHAQSRDQRTKS